MVGQAAPTPTGSPIPPPPAPLRTLADVAARVRLVAGNPPGTKNWDDKLPPATDATWVPLGATVTVQGFRLPGPFYLGRFLPTDPGHGWAAAQCASYLIVPEAPSVPPKPGLQMPSLGQWPFYNLLLPERRYDFLRWMSLGRPAGADVAYAQLAFYGMERRLLVDNISRSEEAALLAEVAELRRHYGCHPSFETLCTALFDLCAARSLLRDPAALEAWRPDPGVFGQPMTACMKVSLACRAVIRAPVPLDLALAGFLARPEAHQGRMAQTMNRARPEFLSLLTTRLRAACPNGVLLEARQHVGLRLPYVGAPQYLGQTLGMRLVCQAGLAYLPEPDNLTWGKLTWLAEAALDDLAPYVKALSTPRGQAGSVDTLALLPRELAYLDPGGKRAELLAWLDTLPKPFARVPFADASKYCLGYLSQSFKDREMRGLAETLEMVGYGVEPDPLYGKLPRNPVPLFIFPASNPKLPRAAPDASIQAGLVAAQLLAYCTKDGQQLDWSWSSEIGLLLGLSEDVARRLAMRTAWQHQEPPTLAAVKKMLEPFAAPERQAMAEVLTGALLRQGWPEGEILPVLERMHDLLGLDRTTLYSALHALSGEPGSVFSLPAPAAAPKAGKAKTKKAATAAAASPGATPRLDSTDAVAPTPVRIALDPVRLARIQAETREVAAALADIMADTPPSVPERPAPAAVAAPATPGLEPPVPSVESTPPAAPPAVPAPPVDARFQGLDARHAKLAAALLAQAAWLRADYSVLAQGMGLKPDGALETINEWAFESLDDALIEDGEPLVVNAHLLPSLPSDQGSLS